MSNGTIFTPNLLEFPTLEPECHDAERRSLAKINELLYQINDSLNQLTKPGAGQVGIVNYVYGLSYTIPSDADLLDVSCYNPTGSDVWVFIVIAATSAQPGMAPNFPIHVYPHNPAYYEAMADAASVPAGDVFSIAVSSTENVLTWNPSPIYLAIRHT
jgi:hypothetical protein